MRYVERRGQWKYAVIFDRPTSLPADVHYHQLKPVFDWAKANCVGCKTRNIVTVGWAIDLKTKADLLLFKLTWGGYDCQQAQKV